MFNTKKIDDIFSNNVNFETDLTFMEMKNIARIFIHSITKNINILIELNKKQTFENTSNINPFQDAGTFYNYCQIYTSIISIGDSELAQIANTFKSTMMNSKYRNISEKITDPLKHILYFTKYMYIPVRINYNSIPQYLQINYLKTWLTTLLLLVTKPEYINKYQSVYKNIDIYKRCLDILMSNEDTRNKLSNTPYQSIENILTTSAVANNGLHNFIQLLLKFVFHINIEIVNKFCPNFNICQTVNKNYDGSWLSPLDPDVNEQLNKFKNIININ